MRANPFAPPTALVADAATGRPVRPFWVSLIFYYQLTMAFLTLVARLMYLLPDAWLPGSVRLRLAQLTWIDHGFTMASLCLKIAAVTALYRLRGFAPWLFLAALLLACGHALYAVFVRQWLTTATLPMKVMLFPSLGISVGMTLYALWLKRQGVLRTIP